jgi:hypothetical protein
MNIRGHLGRSVVLSVLLWPVALVSAQQSDPDRTIDVVTQVSTESLARMRMANELLYSELQNFVCSEKIERYRGALATHNSTHIDTVTSKVSFENGVEHYTEIRQDNRPRSRMSSLSGAWSEAEFGTLLRQTQALLTVQKVQFLTSADFNGVPAAVYRFEVSEEDSPWDLEVDSQHYHVPFRTDVWVARSSGQILDIERTSTAMPLNTRISEIRWSIVLESVELNGKSWLLPKIGEYAVSYAELNRREWNVMTFSDYHRYGSEVALSFSSQP